MYFTQWKRSVIEETNTKIWETVLVPQNALKNTGSKNEFSYWKVNNEPAGWHYNTATVPIGAVSAGLVLWAGHVEHSVANGSQLLQSFFWVKTCVA